MCPVHHMGKNRRRSERLRLSTQRLKIYLWGDEDEQGPQRGFGFVADLSATGVGIYLGEGMRVGDPVRLAFELETGATYRGVVAWSHRYNLEQHFIGHDALSFRVGVRYLFGSEAERQRYLGYQKELADRALLILPGMNS